MLWDGLDRAAEVQGRRRSMARLSDLVTATSRAERRWGRKKGSPGAWTPGHGGAALSGDGQKRLLEEAENGLHLDYHLRRGERQRRTSSARSPRFPTHCASRALPARRCGLEGRFRASVQAGAATPVVVPLEKII